MQSCKSEQPARFIEGRYDAANTFKDLLLLIGNQSDLSNIILSPAGLHPACGRQAGSARSYNKSSKSGKIKL